MIIAFGKANLDYPWTEEERKKIDENHGYTCRFYESLLAVSDKQLSDGFEWYDYIVKDWDWPMGT